MPPLYEYLCPSCGHEFEEFNSIEDRAKEQCPSCTSIAEVQISAPHFDPRIGLDPDFPTFADKWANARERKTKEETAQYKKDFG